MHIFEFFENECIRRGSARANVPLSAFGRTLDEQHIPLNSTHVADHLIPLFEYAAQVIPEEYHATTGVKYQATAGMRLLDIDEQEAVYDALHEGLHESDKFVFSSTTRHDIATLGGDLEGFYGAVAANYLKGIIDIKLNTIESDHDENHGPLGALDMGGSSTQIVYLPNTNTCENEEACHDEMELPSRLNGDDFFATSYLAYGVDQFRERLWDLLVFEQQEEEKQYQDACADKTIFNPCGFKGYELEWKGYTLLGTGDTHECVKQAQRLIPHHEEVHDEILPGTKVGGVEHPPLRGKFFAMSLYYFSLDSLRVLSHPHEEAHEALNLSWPTPSIEELFNALEGLCSRSWQGVSGIIVSRVFLLICYHVAHNKAVIHLLFVDMQDLEEIQHDAHDFTRAEVLPHRCIESVYMVTLLRDGFGFHPSSRDITFTFLVDGSEVEWSLGMALALHAEEHDAMYESEKDYERFVESHVHHEESNATYDDSCEAQTCPSSLT